MITKLVQICLKTSRFVGLFLALATAGAASAIAAAQLPAGFVDIQHYFASHGEDVLIDVRYGGADNFVGEPIDGYRAEKIFIAEIAAKALLAVQAELKASGLALKLFDAYRPQRAVDHFVRWAEDLSDERMKQKYYPNVDKQHLFRDGYIAARSGHSRGSTVDLTIVDRNTGMELDMGTAWDFFDPRSWPSSSAVSDQQRKNRMILRDVMTAAGFTPLKEEWWHFTFNPEAFPDRYFNFVIE